MLGKGATGPHNAKIPVMKQIAEGVRATACLDNGRGCKEQHDRCLDNGRGCKEQHDRCLIDIGRGCKEQHARCLDNGRGIKNSKLAA